MVARPGENTEQHQRTKRPWLSPSARPYLKWALVGLLLRLLVMPFTMHSDLQGGGDIVWMNQVANGIASGQTFYPTVGYPPLAYYTMALFLFLFKPLMPLFPLSDATTWPGTAHIFRYLFLLKVWYLPFDFAAAFLLTRLAADPGKALGAFKFWVLNPLVIYAGYIHGEFDIVPTFFLVLALWQARSGRAVWAAFCLGMSAAYKDFAFFFLLPAVFLLGRSTRERWGMALAGIVPYALLFFSRLGVEGIFVTYARHYTNYLLPLRLDMGAGQAIYVFFAIYGFIVWHSYRSQRKGFEGLWHYVLVILLLYYSVGVFAVHYLTWIMPVAALFWVSYPGKAVPYGVLLASVVVISFSLGRSLAGGLLWPVSPDFFSSLTSPYEFLDARMPFAAVVNGARSIFAATAAWLAYQAFSSERLTMKVEGTDT